MHFDLPINAFDINTKKREGLTIRRQYHGDGRIDQIMHNIIWAALLALALALAFAAPLAAQNHDAGRQAFERGDYAAALREFRPLAERGNALAESRLRRIRHRLGITRAAVPPGQRLELRCKAPPFHRIVFPNCPPEGILICGPILPDRFTGAR